MTTTTDKLRALCERDRDIVAEYFEATHEMTVFLTLHTVTNWNSFQRKSDRTRRALTQRQSSITGIYTHDPSAPKLRTTPTFAAVYDERIKRFVPALNVSIVLQSKFFVAQAEGISACAELNLWTERNGRLPEAGEVPTRKIIYPGSAPGTTTDPGVIDLLGRINS